MSEENLNDEANDDPAGLRKLVQKLQNEMKERDAKLAAYQAQERKSTVADSLKAKGLDPKFAKYFDREEHSTDAVDAWVKDNPELFPVQSGQQEAQDSNAQQAADISQFTGNSEAEVEQTTSGRILGDPEEIMRLLKSNSFEKLQELGYMPKQTNVV